jgi:hypothetical protein
LRRRRRGADLVGGIDDQRAIGADAGIKALIAPQRRKEGGEDRNIRGNCFRTGLDGLSRLKVQMQAR